MIKKIVPRYAALSLLAAVAWNAIIYNGAIALTKTAHKWDMTTAFEELIPLQPGWIVVYFGCFLFWVVNYVLIAHRGREIWFRFFFADLLAELVCGICFIVLPCTNIRPEVVGTDLASGLVRLLYDIDPAQNLFPSIHCLISWFCFAGLRGEKKLPVAYRAFCLIFALAVCASTLFLKQHCLPDIIAGVLLAEGCWYLARKMEIYRPVERLFTGV